VLSARVESEFGEVWVHTTHLSFREHEGKKREDQVLVLDEVVSAHKSDAPQLLMGDFNAMPASDEIRWPTGLTSLGGRRAYYQDAWGMAHRCEPGWTWASANPYTALMHWLRADRRLDYIFVTPIRRDRRGTIRAARVLLDQSVAAPGGGEPTFASDHFAV